MAKVHKEKSTSWAPLFLLLCFALAGSSCFKKNHTEKTSNVKLFGGIPLTADNPGYRNTVFLAGPDKKPHCTASLIAQNLVLYTPPKSPLFLQFERSLRGTFPPCAQRLSAFSS